MYKGRFVMTFNSVSSPSCSQRIIQYPERSSHVYYADNETVPPEKRGQEISNEDYEKLCNTRLGACNPQTLKSLCPKPGTMKKIWNILKHIFKNEAKNPKADDIAEAAKKGVDIWDAYYQIKDGQPVIIQPPTSQQRLYG
jgi:hypothetical protein